METTPRKNQKKNRTWCYKSLLLLLLLGFIEIELHRVVPEYSISDLRLSSEMLPLWNIFLDSHSHTNYSDGHLTPEQSILWHLEQGYNAAIVTDHNTFEGCEEARMIAREYYNDSIKILIGIEWTTTLGHYTFILPPTLPKEMYAPLFPLKVPVIEVKKGEIKEMFESIHGLGGIVIISHYSLYYSCYQQISREQLASYGADYFEIFLNESKFLENLHICNEKQLGAIAGIDMHQSGKICTTSILNVSSFTENAIFESLKQKTVGILYNGSNLKLQDIYSQPCYIEQYLPVDFMVTFGWNEGKITTRTRILLQIAVGTMWFGINLYLVLRLRRRNNP